MHGDGRLGRLSSLDDLPYSNPPGLLFYSILFDSSHPLEVVEIPRSNFLPYLHGW